MKPRHVGRDPLLLEVVAALGAGRVEFGPIHDEAEYVFGFTRPDGSVRLNPSCHVILILLHELVHRLRPAWSERAVRARASRLLNQLSDRERDTLYTILLTTARVRKKPEPL